MRGFQRYVCAGNLGADPVIRQTASGTAVANLSVAVNTKYKDKETTYWVRAVAFGRVAEIFGEYLSKGDAILLEGRLQEQEWEDKEGNPRRTVEMIVDNFTFLGSKGDRNGRDDQGGEDFEDDIPF